MRLVTKVLALAVFSLLTACDTLHTGSAQPAWGPVITSVDIPANMGGGLEATWTVEWRGGTAPFTIAFDMGGGASEDLVATPAVSPFSHTFMMLNPSLDVAPTYTFTVTVSDAQGLSDERSGTYVLNPVDWFATPYIVGLQYSENTRQLTVEARSDDPYDEIWISLQVPEQLQVNATLQRANPRADGVSVASFYFYSSDPLHNAEGDVLVTAADQYGSTSQPETVHILVRSLHIPADSLVAIPHTEGAELGEAVKVTVSTWLPAHGLQYVNGCGLTVDSDADYVAGSFNVGVPAGAAGDTDGFWELMDPSGGFLLPPDSFIRATDIGGGRERWDFNVTPIGGKDVATGIGALFSMQFRFSVPGVKFFGFQEATGHIKRTYYSDASCTEYFWGDISNNVVPGLEVLE